VHRLVQAGIDAVPGEHREADLLQRACEGVGEPRLFASIAVQERPKSSVAIS
jgi:hypothetical protein